MLLPTQSECEQVLTTAVRVLQTALADAGAAATVTRFLAAAAEHSAAGRRAAGQYLHSNTAADRAVALAAAMWAMGVYTPTRPSVVGTGPAAETLKLRASAAAGNNILALRPAAMVLPPAGMRRAPLTPRGGKPGKDSRKTRPLAARAARGRRG